MTEKDKEAKEKINPEESSEHSYEETLEAASKIEDLAGWEGLEYMRLKE